MVQHYKFIYIIIFVAIISAVSTYAINTGIKSETRGFEVKEVQHFSILVPTGGTLISTPYQLVNISTRSFVDSIYNKNWTLKKYNGYGWPTAIFDVNEGGWTLNSINRSYGYYIRLNESSTLEIEGIYINRTSISLINTSLNNGWNMMGYPSVNSKNLSIALSSIEGKWRRLYEYYNRTLIVVDPKLPPFLWGFKNLTPGRGYWVNVIENTTLIINETITL